MNKEEGSPEYSLAEGGGSFSAIDGTSLYWQRVEPPVETSASGSTSASARWARLTLLHGYGDHGGRYRHFTRWLAERGVACHTFDFRGHGRAAGRRGFVRRWEDFLDDLEAFLAVQASWPSPRDEPAFVLGHSHGGLVAVAAALRGILNEANTAGCILSAPYFRGAMHVSAPWRGLAVACNVLWPSLRIATGLREEWLSRDDEMLRESRADPLIHRIATPRWYRATLNVQAEVMRRAGEFRLPLLCLVAGSDGVADADAQRDFVGRAGSPDKCLIEHPEARHELMRDVERALSFSEILNWMRARSR